MEKEVLLITPPFTQMNTPYPATGYLKGFLNTKNISAFQADLGLDVILEMFSKSGLTEMFEQLSPTQNWSYNAQRIYALRNQYVQTIDSVIQFLQGKKPAVAFLIVEGKFLPEASRFDHDEDYSFAFGNMGTVNLAKHLATLYLEDLSDFIVETIDPDFGFSRYAERLGRSANTFDAIYQKLQEPLNWISKITIRLLDQYIQTYQPKLVLLSVPFPGNLFLAFRCGQYIKQNYPNIKIGMGGGYPNTELRSMNDPRVFQFLDFITLDDGEAPIEQLYQFTIGKSDASQFKRTFYLEGDEVVYQNSSSVRDYKQSEVGTPDYTDLRWDEYLSIIEVTNPMHRLWSDGRWNKLTMAHGCYWSKCTFCDISLDYIKVYEPFAARLIVDRMETLIQQNGELGFHFVDEAAPPALMKSVALEIIQRGLKLVWWTNIRFEKSFTYDLCVLLKRSGCIAVSGGLEVASDRILKMIDKGVDLEQVAKVTHNFARSGIMVHAYLMYGFPTQTDQETIDALEVVRQLFENETVQSGFWHQFAMTAHAPVGMNPEKFGVKSIPAKEIGFANNDIVHVDENGADHEKYSKGLKTSLFNYMNGVGFDWKLQKWFDFKAPKTTIPSDFVLRFVEQNLYAEIKDGSRFMYLGLPVELDGNTVVVRDEQSEITFELSLPQAKSIQQFLNESMQTNIKTGTFKEKWNQEHPELPFLLLWTQDWFEELRDAGLVIQI